MVIGGGISGLAAAWELRAAAPGLDVVVLEAADRAGGCVQTRREGGFVFDEGPTGFLNRDPSTLDVAGRLGLADEVVTGCEDKRRRFIFADGRLRRFPDGPETFVTSDLLSLQAKVRMLFEPAIPRRGGGDESVGAFARRRLGREAADLLVDPVMSGIYAGDADRLSLEATLPQMAGADAGRRSLLWTWLEARRRAVRDGDGSPASIGRIRYVSFKGGMGQLAEAVAADLGAAVRYGARASRVLRDGARWIVRAAGDEISCDAVVSAAPGPAARGYLDGLDAAVDACLAGVPYAPVAVVGLGHRLADVPHPMDGFGYLVPSREGGSVLGVLWSTSIYPGHRSPDGKALLRVVLGGERDPGICELDDDALFARARAHLHRVMGISAAPVYEAIARHPVGLPQYRVGHRRRVERADRALAEIPGLHLTGNALRGIGVNACTEDARRTARRVVAGLEAAGLGPELSAAPPSVPAARSNVVSLRRGSAG